MKKGRIFAVALLATAFTGCSQDEHLDIVDEVKSNFTGVMEVTDSRTSLNAENKVEWSADDQVSIFEGDNANSLYKISSITDGKAKFEFVSYTEPATWITLNDNYAVYPYNPANSIDENGAIFAPVAVEYTFKDKASSIAAALMVAKSEGYSLNFTNAQGILCLRLNAQKATKYGGIKTIKFASKSENLTGTAKMSWDETNTPEARIEGDGAGKELVINLDESLQDDLLPESTTGEYAEYYVPVVPTSFEANDLSMSITWADGETYGPIEIPSPFSIGRAKIKNLKHTVGKSGFNGVIEDDITFAEISVANVSDFMAAVEDVEDGGVIALSSDVSFTMDNRTHNSADYYDGIYYIGDKSFTIDLGGKTIDNANGAVNDYLLNFKNEGSKPNTITIKNGKIDAGTAAYCAICTASSSTQKITINLENVEIINNNSNGSTVKVRGGAELNVGIGTKITGTDSYLGVECIASTANIYAGAEIYMNGGSSYNGCLVGVGGNGTVNVCGGYGKGVSGGFIAMISGGIINVAGGEWIANTDGTFANDNKSVLVAQSSGGAKSTINVTGGTFKGGYNCYGDAVDDAQINISGGNFNVDPSSYVVTGKTATENNGIWTVE